MELIRHKELLPLVILGLLVSCFADGGYKDDGNKHRNHKWNNEKSLRGLSKSSAESASQYMLKLYEKYKKDWELQNVEGGDVSSVNTVRSIQPSTGKIKFGDGQTTTHAHVFNVSRAMSGGESLLSAYLHVHPSRTVARRSPRVVVKVYELHDHRPKVVFTSNITLPRHGWQTIQVTPALRGMNQQPHNKAMDLVAITLEQQSEASTKHSVLKEGVGMLSQSFLVLFSNDKQNISRDHVSSYYNAKSSKNSYVNPETGVRQLFRPSNSERLNDKNSVSGLNSGVSKNMKLQARERRSVFDNELPQTNNIMGADKILAGKLTSLPRTNPTILHGRDALVGTTENKYQLEKDSRTSKGRSRFIPYPENYRRRRRRKNRNKRKRDKKKHRRGKERETGDKFNVISPLAPSSDRRGGTRPQCQLRSLKVDFADIGWSDWIISPKSFQSNYCAGSCAFPIKEGVRASNHATIQSILEAIGLFPDVPSPCCVPQSMSSITLLFFDEDHNVVLKNYPGMTVESCACR